MLSLLCRAGEPQSFPIIADIMHTEFYDAERFRDIHKAGFNACLCWCRTPKQMQAALGNAGAHGMRVIMFSNLFFEKPEKYIPLVMGHEALWQYYLADEPTLKNLETLTNQQKRIKKIDPHAQCYINLLPNGSREVLQMIGVEKYPQYLQAFSSILQSQISYDFYPVQGKVVRGDIWYKILNDIREESLRTGRPFWAYVLCVPHFIFPMPTIGHLRLQCYVNLAYGAQGIQYFSYSTPEPTEQYDFHDGPLLRNGKKSRTYSLVKKMNAELKPVASLFWQSKVTGIEHRRCIGGEVVVSHFQKNGERYTCFVNKSAEKDVTVSLRPREYAQRIRKDLKAESVKPYYTLPAGDILILKMKSEEATLDGRREGQ